MAQKGRTSKGTDSTKTSKGKEKVKWQGYVNYDLNDNIKSGIQTWLEGNPNVDDMVHRVTEDGYDLKVRYDDYSQCMSAQLYCTDANSPNAGWCLSVRASDWVSAMWRVLYLHFIAFEGVWIDPTNTGWNDDQW